MLTKRPAPEADYPFMQRAHHEAMRSVVVATWGHWDPPFQAQMARAQFDEGAVEILEFDGVPVGYQVVTPIPDGIELNMLAILLEQQGRGMGTQAVRQLQDQARTRGVPVTLTVLFKNVRARALYERLGFVVDGHNEHHHKMRWTPASQHEA